MRRVPRLALRLRRKTSVSCARLELGLPSIESVRTHRRIARLPVRSASALRSPETRSSPARVPARNFRRVREPQRARSSCSLLHAERATSNGARSPENHRSALGRAVSCTSSGSRCDAVAVRAVARRTAASRTAYETRGFCRTLARRARDVAPKAVARRRHVRLETDGARGHPRVLSPATQFPVRSGPGAHSFLRGRGSGARSFPRGRCSVSLLRSPSGCAGDELVFAPVSFRERGSLRF